LPNGEFDRHALCVGAFGKKLDRRINSLDRSFAALYGLSLDRGDAAIFPPFEDRIQQRPAILEATVESSLGNSQPLGQHLHPNPIDTAGRQFCEPGRHPVLRCIYVCHSPSLILASILDTVAY
jgi:hypothetical protein